MTAERTDTGESIELTAGFVFSCSGYYRYDHGYQPDFEGLDRFEGTIVHPQHWPEDLDYSGKRIVVIGSGATAVTLIPSLAGTAAHVTMLQRSPSYIVSMPEEPIANRGLRALVERRGCNHPAEERAQQRAIYQLSKRYPRTAKKVIRTSSPAARRAMTSTPISRPRYNPWDQRMCLVPDGDLFKAISAGSASVVTERIDDLHRERDQAGSGKELEADIIVTATGLNLEVFGGMTLTVDGVEVNVADRVAYKGLMLDGVPNLAFTFGYTNSSWTLKVGLVGDHFTRLLADMDANDHQICYPQISDLHMETSPLLGIGAGYVKRSIDQFPRQGDDGPWRMTMDYTADVKMLRDGPVEDESLRFATATVRAAAGDLVLTA